MVNTSLRKIFEQEGIGLINLKAGADYLVQEICSNGDRPVEVVIMGKKSGDRLQESIVSRAPSPLSVTFKRQLNVEDYPFLKSHVMNGRAVLPMAIIIEWMGHGAMHGNPGMKFAGFDNLRILKALTMEDHENCIIQILAGKALMNGSTRTVSVELTSSGGNGSNYVHARAEILLAKSLPKGNNPVTEIPLQPYPLKTDEIYDTKRLFHGPEFRGLERVEGYSEHGIVAIAKAAPLPSTWMKSPLRNTWLADPLILDSSFQMMVLWRIKKNGVGSL
ncbi:MAG: polyketide synthase dehydratase domain-containing protein, partial [Deltaproteobacteria bacterium]|nr:polyketide synthase dehydratase domain-containing protein [Deltaproteobacteria bacterium]